MARPKRAEIWVVDLGLAAKARPCLLLTDWPKDEELAMITVLAHTTTLRQTPWEFSIPKPFLQPGAFHFQLIHSVPVVKLIRKLGELTPNEFDTIKAKLKTRFGL